LIRELKERSEQLEKLYTRVARHDSPNGALNEAPASNGHRLRSDAVLSDERIIELCRRADNAPKFEALYDRGDVVGYEGDDSRADLALVSILAFYTQDREQLDRLFRTSALYREKWGRRPDYRRRTIDKALSGLSETYAASDAGLSTNGHKTPPIEGDKDGTAKERIFPFRTAKEVTETTPQEVPWTAKPWLAKGAITEIDGPIKRAGKTTLVSHMVGCILDGRPFMGEPTTKTKVVFLTEQPTTTFRQVLERAGLMEREDLLILHWHGTIGAQWPDVARAAADKAREFGAELLVVDTLGQFAGIRGDAENSAGAAQEAMEPLQEAASKGLAVLITRHERKGGGEVGESARGSSAFGGAVDVIMSVRRHQGETRPTVRVIESLSRFDETPDRLVVELTERGYRSLGDASAFAEKEAAKAIVDVLPSKFENAMKTDDILDKLKEQNIKRTVVTEALVKLASAGTIRKIGEGKKGNPYRYYIPVSEDEKDSSALKDRVPDERKLELDATTLADVEDSQIHSSGTSIYIADERKTEEQRHSVASSECHLIAEEEDDEDTPEATGVSELLANPPDWLRRQVEKHLEDPQEGTLRALCVAVANAVLSNPC
jgi:primase/DNA polymerase family protein/AAA domain-containing protein